MSRQIVLALIFVGGYATAMPTAAQQTSHSSTQRLPGGSNSAERQAELESALDKMLSGATLEGSYTSTGGENNASRLSSDKYTLGDVRKVGPGLWLIPARIEYGDHDVTLPVTVPIRWAGDTPVIVVDNLGLPPFGTVSARVMFFGGHYAGYWQHGEHGGHLFGVIKQPDREAALPQGESQPLRSPDPPAAKQVHEQRGQD